VATLLEAGVLATTPPTEEAPSGAQARVCHERRK